MVPSLRAAAGLGAGRRPLDPLEKGADRGVVPESSRVEAGFPSLLRVPAAKESVARGVPGFSVFPAMPPWLRGARTGPGHQVRLRLRSTQFAIHSAPLHPRPAASRSLTLFRRRRDPCVPRAKSGSLFYPAYFGGSGGAGTRAGRNL